jgi:hypothetical protein
VCGGCIWSRIAIRSCLLGADSAGRDGLRLTKRYEPEIDLVSRRPWKTGHLVVGIRSDKYRQFGLREVIDSARFSNSDNRPMRVSRLPCMDWSRQTPKDPGIGLCLDCRQSFPDVIWLTSLPSRPVRRPTLAMSISLSQVLGKRTTRREPIPLQCPGPSQE